MLYSIKFVSYANNTQTQSYSNSLDFGLEPILRGETKITLTT